MTEQNLQQHLYDLLAAATLVSSTDDDQITVPPELVDAEEGIDWVSTFAEAGVLTDNPGVVVRMKDHREFQVTIVRSR